MPAVNISVSGRVQGVGFRPYIFALAKEFEICGTVQNNLDGVKIYAEGLRVHEFAARICKRPPRLAKINEITIVETKVKGVTDFTIIPSLKTGAHQVVVPIDAAICDDCINEINDPTNFRYLYPFINCTQCGPRYTIIKDLPYDRPLTSMKNFPMCKQCEAEYNDHHNRRHHAQPVACPKCGPKLELFAISGKKINIKSLEVITHIKKLIKEGYIVAIKGLGGYHLCCDATNVECVKKLRARKRRPNRPLAIMCSSSAAIRSIAEMSEYEESLLNDPTAPILLLKKKKENFAFFENVAPYVRTIGVMLPYTALHRLLLDDEVLPYMVTTSANPSGLPMVYEDENVLQNLSGIADFVLMHNREIVHCVDDSVVQVVDKRVQILRRGRGFVPEPFSSSANVHGIVAFGAQMKNAFALGRYEQIIVGPHIGDLEHVEIEEHFCKELSRFILWFDIPQKIAAVDMHPNYATHRLALLNNFEQIIYVQHHHAHMAACMEDNGINEPCYGIILDGTGYGLDGNLWGFEIFFGDKKDFTRLGHLRYTPLPGGDKAIYEPWRNASAMLISLFGDTGFKKASQIFSKRQNELKTIKQMLEKNINSPLCGSCGRLFDAVSAILGICDISTYDGEAAIRLSETAEKTEHGYSFAWHDDVLDISEMMRQLLLDLEAGMDISIIAGKFQQTIVESIVSKMKCFSLGKVVLSGGSFQNKFLQSTLKSRLEKNGFKVYTHENIPPNDGGIAVGQLVIASKKLED